MTVYINGTTGYSGPVGTIGDLTTTGNTTLGDASGDTLTLNGNTASIPNGLNFTNGNIGIGVTPSAWLSTRKVFQNGNAALVSATSVPAFLQLSANTFTDSGGTDKYISTAAATNYAQVNGQHQWFYAASGSAGATATFTQAMTLDASGRLVVNGTSPYAYSVLTLQQSSSLVSALALKNRNSNQTWAIAVDAMAVDDKDLGFLDVTNNTMRMILSDAGNLTVGGSVTAGSSITSTAFTTSGAYGAQATLGSGVTSWAGSAYPTLYGSAPERWVMHMNPHICYTVNGTNGYTGSMTGASIRFGGTPTYGSSWDVGIGCGGVGADIFTINKDNTSLYKLNSSGQGFFTQGNGFVEFGPNTTWSAILRVGGNGNNDTGKATVCTTNGNLHLDAASSYIMYLNYYSGSGGVNVHNGAGNGGYGTIKAAAFTVSSDYRLKENIVGIADGALASVLALSPKEYDLTGYDTRRFYGFLAHELAEHFPITVVGEKDAVAKDGKPDYQGVEYMQLVPVLVKALQELDAKFEAYRLTHP